MDDELMSHEAQALLDDCRDVPVVTAERREAVRQRLLVRAGIVGAAVAATQTTAAAGLATTAAGIGKATVVKVLVGAAIVAGIGVGATKFTERSVEPTPAPAPPVLAPRVLPEEVVVPTPTPVETAVQPAPTRARAPEPRPSRAVPPPPAPALERDLARLRQARRALDEGRPQEALELLGPPPTAANPLRLELEAARLITSCRMGRVEAVRADVAAFLAQQGESPLTPSVRDACRAK